jgi:hypothetical protein
MRILEKLDTWLTVTHPDVREIDVDFNKSAAEKWGIISKVMKDWPPSHQSDKWRAYGHTIFCFKQMGLGP